VLILNLSSLEKAKRLVFFLTGVSCLLFILFLTLSIVFYPGGTRFDKYFVGYNFLETFPSDLGRAIAINDQVNTLSKIFFVLGIFVMSTFQLYYYLAIPFFIRAKKASFGLAIFGSILGIISSILYMAIALNPTDVKPKLHNRLIYSSAPLIFVTAVVFIIAIFVDRKFPKFFAYVYLGLFSLFFIFAIATLVGSQLENNYINWVIRILGHNILVFLEAAIFAILNFGVWKYLETLSHQEQITPEAQKAIT